MIDLTKPQVQKENKFLSWIINKLQYFKNYNSLFYYVLLLVGVSFGFYFLMLVNNQFTTPYSGDFVMQYIPFAYDYYDNWWSFFKTGVFPHWDSNIFLGADAITSDGYYILFSPFFALLLFFPREWIPQMMVFVSVLRMVLAGVFFRLYLKKLGINELLSRFGGIAFMCCGWVAYFQWFNNFLDIAVFLPLILLGIEKVLQDKKPWLLIASLGYLGIDNFFFFPAICIMTFVYSIFRYFQRLKLNNYKNNLLILLMGFLGYVGAVGISLIVFIPGLITGMSDPKIEGTSYLATLLEYWESKDFSNLFAHLFIWDSTGDFKLQASPIIEFFVFPTTCRHISLVNAISGNTFVNEAGSLWVGVPISFFFFPAFINSIRKGKISHIIGVAIFIFVLFTPFSYYLLFGGAKAYSRWTIIFPACMIAYVLSYLNSNYKKISTLDLLLGLGFMTIGILGSGLLAHYFVSNSYNLKYYLPFPWALIGEIVYILCFFFVLLYFYNKPIFSNILLYFCVFESVLVGNFVTVGHSYTSPVTSNGGSYNNALVYDASKKIKDYDSSYYRSYSSLAAQNLSDNNQNINNYNGTAMFNTLYNFYTREFKWWTRMSDWYGGWSASYVEKRQALDYFLNIKYYMVNKNNTIATKSGYENLTNEQLASYINVPLGYEYNSELSNEGVLVFENKNVNKIGFSYNQIYVYEDENANNALSGSGSYALRNDDMFLLRGIMAQSTYDSLNNDIKNDLTFSDTALQPYRADSTYHDISVVDTKNLSLAYGEQYIMRYYKVEDSRNYPINNLKNIILNEKASDRDQILSDNSAQNGDYFITITKEDLNGDVYKNPSSFASLMPFDYFENGTALYLYAPYTPNYNVDVYLLNKDGEVIKFDNHRDDYVTNSLKSMRGFYSDEEIYAVVIYPRYYGRSSFDIYLESYQDYQNKLNTEVSAIQGEYLNSNEFSFETNYDQYKMISLNTPYERGWSVYATQGNETIKLDTFQGQGGFLSFISLKGPATYHAIYRNADMVKVQPITNVTFVLFSVSYIIYLVVSNYKKEKERNKKLRLDA